MRRLIFAAALLAALSCLPSASGGLTAQVGESAQTDRITLLGGDSLTGRIESLDASGTLRLRDIDASGTSDIHISRISGIRLNAHREIPFDFFRREFVFELTDGTRITGRVVSWEAGKAAIATAYAGVVRFDVKSISHILTSIDGELGAIDNGADHVIVLKNGERISGALLRPVMKKSRIVLAEWRVQVGDEIKTVPASSVCGIVFPAPAANPPKADRPAPGWYARVVMPNFDRIIGTLDSLKGGKLIVTSECLGVLKIERNLVNDITFSPLPQSDYGYLLVCDAASGRVMEYDSQMRRIWSFKVKKPQFATRLQNGNILICDSFGKRTIEVNRGGEVVWERRGEIMPTCAARLPNGNTLILDEKSEGRIVEIRPDGALAGRHLDFGRQDLSKSRSGKTARPSYFIVLGNGNLLVCDRARWRDGRVLETTMDDKIVRVIGRDIRDPALALLLPGGKYAYIGASPSHGGFDLNVVTAAGKSIVRRLHQKGCGIALSGAGNILVPEAARGGVRIVEYAVAKDDDDRDVLKEVSHRMLPSGGISIIHIESN